MNRKHVWIGTALVALLAVAGLAVADHHEKKEEPKEITLSGEYEWNYRGSAGALKAVLTETGKDQFDISFYFDFREKPHVYSGTASGTIGDGTLTGKVYNESKERTFAFTGSFEDGRFSGTHEELTEGRAGDTGTLWLE